MADRAAHGSGNPEVPHEEAHASNRTYVQIALILAGITFVEVVIYYVPTVRPLLIPALIILSLAKFVMVVSFFMHLKYDHRLYRFMFAAGMAVTLGVYLAFLAMAWTGNLITPELPAA